MPSSYSRPIAWLVFAICIRDTQPSCMRAPPDAEITSSGIRRSSASSAPRVIDSPTAPPMLPPMKPKSIPATTSGLPSIVPVPKRPPDFAPDFFWAALIRSGYGFESTNESASSGSRSPDSSS